MIRSHLCCSNGPTRPKTASGMRKHLHSEPEPLQAMVHELLGMHNNIVDLKKAIARGPGSLSSHASACNKLEVQKDARPELERIVMSPLQEPMKFLQVFAQDSRTVIE